MIFASLFLLVVSAVLFAIGVSKSSIGYLVTALAAAAGASLLLLAGYAKHRREQELAQAGAANGGAGMPAVGNGQGQQQQQVFLVPVAPGQSFVMPSVGGPAAVAGIGGPPFVGYDNMTATQVVTLVRSGALTAEQLNAIAIYEAGHQGRKTIMDAVSGKVESA